MNTRRIIKAFPPTTYRWSFGQPNMQQIPLNTEEAQAVIESYRNTYPPIVAKFDEIEARSIATFFNEESTP